MWFLSQDAITCRQCPVGCCLAPTGGCLWLYNEQFNRKIKINLVLKCEWIVYFHFHWYAIIISLSSHWITRECQCLFGKKRVLFIFDVAVSIVTWSVMSSASVCFAHGTNANPHAPISDGTNCSGDQSYLFLAVLLNNGIADKPGAFKYWVGKPDSNWMPQSVHLWFFHAATLPIYTCT